MVPITSLTTQEKGIITQSDSSKHHSTAPNWPTWDKTSHQPLLLCTSIVCYMWLLPVNIRENAGKIIVIVGIYVLLLPCCMR